MTPPADPLVVIPARLASSRLPRKMLEEVGGEAQVVHVWRCAAEARIGRVAVACDDTEIRDVVVAAGGEAVMTDPQLPSGTDRVAAAADILDAGERHDAVINLQGDMRDVGADALRAVLSPLAEDAFDIATVATVMDPALSHDANSVKAVLALPPGARVGRALYFSRATVPAGDGPLYHHFGLYAFRRAALRRFVALPPGELERRERLEQLRALEAGMRIGVALIDRSLREINTPADLARERARLARHG